MNSESQRNCELPADELRAEVTGGLLYCHSRLNANTSKLLESASFLYALVELLAEKGFLKYRRTRCTQTDSRCPSPRSVSGQRDGCGPAGG